MNKFPFNAVGFEELQQDLYQLNDAMLAQEAHKIKHQFSEWLPSRFEMQSSQLAFLSAMDQRSLSFIAEQTSYAVGNRLPVSLAKSDPPKKDDDQGKIVYTKSSLTVKDGKGIGFIAGGELHFEIFYEA